MKVTTDGCLFGAWIADEIQMRQKEAGNVLDIGTGTGLLSLMLLQKKTGITIDAIEIDKDAFEQASQNVINSPWAGYVNVIHRDAKEFKAAAKYDVIISNPPFYANELKGNNKKKNIAHHNEGLLLPELLQIIRKNLKNNGVFFLLLPYKRNKEIKELLTEHEFEITKLTFVRQSVNHDYFRIIVSGKFKKTVTTETAISEISIKGITDEYSPAFTRLLKDYYLNL